MRAHALCCSAGLSIALTLSAPALSIAPQSEDGVEDVSTAPIAAEAEPQNRTRGEKIGAFLTEQFERGAPRVRKRGEKPVGLFEGSASQYLLVGTYLTGHAFVLKSAILSAGAAGLGWSLIPALSLAALGIYSADLTGGLIHFAFDNYGSENTPLVGSYIRRFREHHMPGKVQAQGNASMPAMLSGFAPIPLILIPPALLLGAHSLPLMAFMSTFSIVPWTLVAHMWAHKPEKLMSPGEREIVRTLRAAKQLISEEDHNLGHHGKGRAHAATYATLSGMSNPFLDHPKLKPLRRIEKLVFQTTGVMSNAWREGPRGLEVMEAALGSNPKLLALARTQLSEEAENKLAANSPKSPPRMARRR